MNVPSSRSPIACIVALAIISHHGAATAQDLTTIAPATEASTETMLAQPQASTPLLSPDTPVGTLIYPGQTRAAAPAPQATASQDTVEATSQTATELGSVWPTTLGDATSAKPATQQRKTAKASTTKRSNRPSSRPTSPKPTAPPVIGGVYYPPSSPVYHANGYTWGYEPGRYQPGRYTPGRYEPGRYTPGRYVPPGGAAAAVLQAEEEARNRSRKPARKYSHSRAETTGRWEDAQPYPRQYGQFPALPGNGGVVPVFIPGGPIIIVEP